MFLATKAMDTTRPVLDTSGYSHRVPEADVYDSHDYSQDPDQLAQHQAGLAAGNPYRNSAASWGMPARTAARLVGSLEWSWTRASDRDRLTGTNEQEIRP